MCYLHSTPKTSGSQILKLFAFWLPSLVHDSENASRWTITSTDLQTTLWICVTKWRSNLNHCCIFDSCDNLFPGSFNVDGAESEIRKEDENLIFKIVSQHLFKELAKICSKFCVETFRNKT